jgi:TetR/AcrR family transcriptional regulator
MQAPLKSHAEGAAMHLDNMPPPDIAPDPLSASPALPSRSASKRSRMEAEIIAVAVRVFAESGFEGSAIAAIAEQAGLSKQNLMYYFPTKQLLYQRVLDDVLDDWLQRMSCLEADGEAPQELLRGYIRAKLRFSREQPWASRVYALEVVKGAQLYGAQIERRVVPQLRRDIAVFERWIAQGQIAPLNATHLLFAIWAMTQSYADFGAQMALVLGQNQLTDDDFDAAEKLIVDIVLGAVKVQGQLPDSRQGT